MAVFATGWKINKYKADAGQAYREISQLESITPENVVELARNESSVIHDDFEWDDAVAGEKYRVIQARQMIQNFVFQTEESDRPMRVLEISTEKKTYKPVDVIVSIKEEYQSLLDRAIRELQAFKERYKHIAELEEVIKAIDQL